MLRTLMFILGKGEQQLKLCGGFRLYISAAPAMPVFKNNALKPLRGFISIEGAYINNCKGFFVFILSPHFNTLNKPPILIMTLSTL